MGEKKTDVGGHSESAVNYRAFLIRCWKENGGGEVRWRFALVQIDNQNKKKGFANLEELFSFLSSELDFSIS